METIITFISGIVAAIVGYLLLIRNSRGTEGIKRSIQRTGENINRARGRIKDNYNRACDIAAEIKESRKSAERASENELNNIKRVENVKKLVRRGRKAVEGIEKKNGFSEN